MARTAAVKIEDPPVKTFPFKVEMDLTPDELIAYGEEDARLELELEAAELKLQSARGVHKNEVSRINGRRKEVLNFVRTKKEHKPVECFIDLNYTDGWAYYVRVDGGEIVHRRRMTKEEYRGTPLFDADDIQEVEVSEGKPIESFDEPEEIEDGTDPVQSSGDADSTTETETSDGEDEDQ
jgi:hypothetical protein